MDNVTRAFYEAFFEREFLKMHGNAFQDFFSEIMEKRYPGDFIRVRPWGNVGDRKNDGYRKSDRSLFQVYAPNKMTANKTISKIEEDFDEALPYWEDFFDNWIFVHNSRGGLGPDVTKTLLEIDRSNPQIKVTHWGFEELRQEAMSLDETDLASLFGPAPTNNVMLQLGFDSLQVVLLTIARQQPPPNQQIRPVPPDKLSANALSDSVETLLSAGMTRSDLVEQFFNKWYDPRLGNEVAEAFTREYQRLRGLNILPNLIFQELMKFAGGTGVGTPEHIAAVLAVLAYLFEKCEIFEEPSTETLI
jgi:hypothetical protein